MSLIGNASIRAVVDAPRVRRASIPRLALDGSLSRTNSTYSPCGAPGTSTATESGSPNPVR